MICLALPVASALLALAPSEIESAAARHVTHEYERVGRSAPASDAPLTQAARALAREALASSASDAADLLTLVEALSAAGGADPSPRALIVRGAPRAEPLDSFLARKDFNDEPASHLGVGAAVSGELAALVVLLADRKAVLQPFSRALPKAGAAQPLCGELAPHLVYADLYVTRPSGQVEKQALTVKEGSEFCVTVTFPTQGRHTVEVIGRGVRGPEVAALFFVQVGAADKKGTRGKDREPTTVEAARAEIAARIDALRKSHGLANLAFDHALDEVAQAYADQMAAEGFFAHVAPDGTDLRARMHRAGYACRDAGENLGLASGPLAAHFGIEHSPGHRRNLIEPGYTRVGMGIVFQKVSERPQALLVEVFSTPADPMADPPEEAYRSISQRRSAMKLPGLSRSEALERIARDHVKKAIELESPSTQLPGERIHDRVFAALDDVATASVDFFVAESPALVTDSKSLANPKNDRVGVGVLKGDSQKYGMGKYWVVVIYAAP